MKRWYLVIILGVTLVAVACGAEATLTRAPTATPTTVPDPTPTPIPGATQPPRQTDTPAPTPTTAPEPSPTASSEVDVEVKNFAHQNVTVQAGSRVTWIQRDGAPHTTTSGVPGEADAGDLWDSPTLGPGQKFSHAFTEAGTFRYFCRIHPSTMQATVTVVAGPGAQPKGDAQPTATPVPSPTPIAAPTANRNRCARTDSNPRPSAHARSHRHGGHCADPNSPADTHYRTQAHPHPHPSPYPHPNPNPTPTLAPTPTSTPVPAPTPTPEATGAVHNVDMTGGNRFAPANITVKVSDTVKWTVTGSLHTTTSGAPGAQTQG